MPGSLKEGIQANRNVCRISRNPGGKSIEKALILRRFEYIVPETPLKMVKKCP